MRRLVASIAGAAAGLLAYRLFTWRSRHRVAPPEEAGPDPRAEELRAKLATTQESDAVPEAAPESEDVESRRRSVHERGRAAIDEMQGGDTPDD